MTSLNEWLAQSLAQLLERDDIDTRLYNIGIREGWVTRGDLLHHYITHACSLSHLNGAGAKMNRDLSLMLAEGRRVHGLQDKHLLPVELDTEPDAMLFPVELPRLSKLGMKAAEALWLHSGRDVMALFVLIYTDARWRDIPQMTPRIARELEDYWPERLEAMVAALGESVDHEELILIASNYPKAIPQYLGIVSRNPPQEITLLDLAMLLFGTRHPIGGRKGSLLEYYFNPHTRPTLEETGKQFGITRERVRQIVIKYMEDFLDFNESFWKVFGRLRERWLPSAGDGIDCIVVNSELLLQWIPGVHLGVALEIRLKLLVSLLEVDFEWFATADIETALAIFVRRDVLLEVDWDGLQDAVRGRLERGKGVMDWERFEEIYPMFVRVSPQNPLWGRIAEVLPAMLHHVAGIRLLEDQGLLALQNYGDRTARRQHLRNMLRQFLEEAARPLSFHELYEQLLHQDPLLNIEPDQLPHLLRNMEGVVSLGLTGYYCLISHLSHIPAVGPWMTFVELAVHFLKERPFPLHISELEKEVAAVRVTSRASLTQTLEIGGNGDLVGLGAGFWGLRSRGHDKISFQPVSKHLWRTVARILAERGALGIGLDELADRLKQEHGLQRVQVVDWVRYRVSMGKLTQVGDHIYGVKGIG